MPKYKKKQIRQHPKKRIERNVYHPSLSEYYDINELYNAPEDEFDFIPSFRQRQLKSAEYEFDPTLVDDHKKSESSVEAGKPKGVSYVQTL